MAARKTSTKPTRIWKFSARVRDDAAVQQILMQANRYYNDLVAIDRARHARYIAIRRQYAPELAALEDEWECLEEQAESVLRDVKRARQAHWREHAESRRLLPAIVQPQLDALRAEQKRVSAAAKEHRAAFTALLDPAREEFKRRSAERAKGGGPRTKSIANAAVLEEMLAEAAWSGAWKATARSDDEAHAATLAARAKCGLSTGTYLQIEEAVQRAKKDSAPRPPRFRRFAGSGKLAVQVRNATYADALAGTSTLTISPAPHDPNKKGDQSCMVAVRLYQSVPRGERQTIELTAKLHRAPPPDAEIKWAALLVRRVGTRTVYELQLTIEHESFGEAKRPPGTRDAVHVRIGWARVDGGIRVAYWPGGDVVVPEGILAQHEHAATIESAADIHFERAKALLRRWMRGGPHALTAWHRMRSDHARAMLRQACVAYAQHQLGADNLRALWAAWKADRLSRAEDLYALPRLQRAWLEHHVVTSQQDRAAFWAYCWACKDEHLCQYAVDSRRRFTSRRDALFRAEAIRIATEFSTVAMDAYRIASLKELPSLAMPGDVPRDPAQHNAQAAAPGRFREILVELMGPRCSLCERSSGEPKAAGARGRKRETRRQDTPSAREGVPGVPE